MSRHFSVLELYNTIRHNDVENLKRAIFFLGYKIHRIKLWGCLGPLSLATRLGHFQQARILLKDLGKRHKTQITRNWKIEAILSDQTPRFEIGREFVADFVFQNMEMVETHEDVIEAIDILCDLNAKKELELLAEKDAEKYIPALLQYSKTIRSRIVFEMTDTVRNHPVFVRVLQSMSVDEDLSTALWKGDPARIRELLLRTTGNQLWVDQFEFQSTVARFDDVAMFNALFDNETVDFNVTICDHQYTEKATGSLLKRLFDEALKMDSCNIVKAVLEHKNFDSSSENFNRHYIKLLLQGSVKSAAAIQHLVDFTDLEKIDQALKTVGVEIRHLSCFTPQNVLEEIIEQFDAIFALTPELRETWISKIAEFPLTNRRPDLIPYFRQKFGIKHTESDVLNRNLDPWTKIDIGHLNGESNYHLNNSKIASILLGSHKEPIKLQKNCFSSVSIHVLEYGIVQTGKSFILDGNSQTAHKTEKTYYNRAFELENRRRTSLTLQKLCRLAIREVFIRKNTTEYSFGGICVLGNVDDDILSLYTDEHLPKQTVEYLLYRDYDNALYYQLLYF